ncbi:MAG: hypothetical protein IPI60_20565 [Saprospiraceae bacterium]|nr:hypothetical protein [Saprospiraceae bacterium]
MELRAFKNPEDAASLITHIESVISNCVLMAEQCKKTGSNGGSLTLYNNRVLHTNNIILAGNKEQKMIFITHDNPNFIYSEDDELYKYSENWLDKLKSSGQLLSGSQNPNASDYFRTLHNKVEIAKKKIRGLISRDDEML